MPAVIDQSPPVGNAVARPGPRVGRMLVVVVAWGSCFLLITWGLRDAPVLWFAALRALVAGVALLLAAAVAADGSRRRVVPRGVGTWALVALLGLLNVTVVFAAIFGSITGGATGVASVLANTQALMVVLPAWWLFGERPRPAVVAGVMVGFGGLVLIAAPAGGGRGAVLALLAAAGIAVGTLLARRLEDVNLLVLGAWQFLLGGAALAVAAAVVEGPPTVVVWTGRFTGILLALALGATAVPYVLWFAELRRAALTSVTAWTLLVPVVGVVLGVLVLGEAVTLIAGVGDAMVVAALVLVTYSSRTAGRRPAGTTDAGRVAGPRRDIVKETSP